MNEPSEVFTHVWIDLYIVVIDVMWISFEDIVYMDIHTMTMWRIR